MSALSTTMTDDDRLPNPHPGEILLEEFLKPMGITAYRLAKSTQLPPQRVNQIVNEKRGITVEDISDRSAAQRVEDLKFTRDPKCGMMG